MGEGVGGPGRGDLGYWTPERCREQRPVAREIIFRKQSVATSAVMLVDENPNRVFLNIRLLSDPAGVTVSLVSSENQDTSNSYDLIQQGDSYEWNLTNPYVGKVYCVVSSGTVTVSVMEGSV